MGTDADADADAQRNTDAGQRSSTAAVLAGRATTLPKLLQCATNHQVPPCRRVRTVLEGLRAVHVYRVCGTDGRGPAGCWCGLLQSADAVVAFYDALPAVGVGVMAVLQARRVRGMKMSRDSRMTRTPPPITMNPMVVRLKWLRLALTPNADTAPAMIRSATFLSAGVDYTRPGGLIRVVFKLHRRCFRAPRCGWFEGRRRSRGSPAARREVKVAAQLWARAAT